MRTTLLALFVIAAASCAPPRISAEESKAAGAQGGQSIRVQSFRFVGNSAVTTEALSGVVEPYQGQEQTLEGLKSVADKVAAYYRQRGYFLASVVLPEQDVSGGAVTFQVFEGKLGKITFSGSKRYSEEALQEYFTATREQGVLKQDDLERSLLLLNELPGLKATSALEAGQEQGTTDLAINLEEKPLVGGSVEMNNFGSRYSRERMSVGMNVGTLRGDTFAVSAVSGAPTKSLYFGTLNYSGPVGHSGTRVGLYALTGNFGIGKEFAALNIQGRATSFGAMVSHPVVKTRRQTITLTFGLDSRDSKQELLSTVSSYDRIRVAQLGVNRSSEDTTGRTYASLSVHQGLGGWLGGMNCGDPRSSRPWSGADNRFTKLVADVARVQFISRRTFVVARASGQASKRSLVSGEQMVIGGADSVRGYPQSEFSGDSGAQASVEMRIAAIKEKPEVLQGVLFVDYGFVSTKKPAVGQTRAENLAGVGFGVRSTPWKGITIRGDVGFPVGHRPSNGHRIAPYFQVSSSF